MHIQKNIFRSFSVTCPESQVPESCNAAFREKDAATYLKLMQLFIIKYFTLFK